jgi:hypothetical protein
VIGRIAQRIVLVVVAVAAILWLAHGLRALSLDAQGRDVVRAAGQHPSPAQVSRAVSRFGRAARLNADPTPKIDQATLFLRLGRVRQAAGLLDGVVRANPGNIRAWTMLASTTTQSNPRRSVRAFRALRDLFGRPPGRVSPQEPIVTRSGRIFRIVPELVNGTIDSSLALGGEARISGWAGSVKYRRRASLVVVFFNGRLVGEVAPRQFRVDVARSYPPLARAGFVIQLPLRLLEARGKRGKIQVFGIDRQAASAIPFDCNRHQALGCGQ